jgi:ABC-type sugar transport system substrate-binding protein
MSETLPSDVHLVNLKGKWTEESAYQNVCSWLQLTKTQKFRIDLITAQNDVMAIGAKKAVKESADEMDRDDLAGIPVTGCGGVLGTGQAWVRAGHMVATVVLPPNAVTAITLMTRSLQRKIPPEEHVFTSAEPFPSIESMKRL